MGFGGFFPKAEFTKDLQKNADMGLAWLLEEGKAQKQCVRDGEWIKKRNIS